MGAGSPLSFFEKLEKLESPGEKTGDFSLLDQANINFLEKETCQVVICSQAISYMIQIADSEFNT